MRWFFGNIFLFWPCKNSSIRSPHVCKHEFIKNAIFLQHDQNAWTCLHQIFSISSKKIDPRKICPCLTINIHTKNFPFFAKVLFSSSWVSVYFLGILWVFLQTNLPMVEPFSNGKWQNIPWHIRWLSSLGPFPVTLQT